MKGQYLRALTKSFYDAQESRISMDNRLRQAVEDEKGTDAVEFLGAILNRAERQEDLIEDEIERIISRFDLYTEYLQHIKGIGIMMSANLLSYLGLPREHKRSKAKDDNPRGYETVEDEDDQWWYVSAPPVMEVGNKPSNIWSYSGLAPGQGRTKGEEINYNPEVKDLTWKVLTQQMMARSHYHNFYTQYREEYDNKEGWQDKSDGHRDNAAKRKVKKMFLQHYWLMFRHMRGLTKNKTYVEEHLGHVDIIPPFTEKDGRVQYLTHVVPETFNQHCPDFGGEVEVETTG